MRTRSLVVGYFPAIFLTKSDAPHTSSAEVISGNPRRHSSSASENSRVGTRRAQHTHQGRHAPAATVVFRPLLSNRNAISRDRAKHGGVLAHYGAALSR